MQQKQTRLRCYLPQSSATTTEMTFPFPAAPIFAKTMFTRSLINARPEHFQTSQHRGEILWSHLNFDKKAILEVHPPKGLPYMTSGQKGEGSSRNTQNLRTNRFCGQRRGGGQKITNSCERHIWKPNLLTTTLLPDAVVLGCVNSIKTDRADQGCKRGERGVDATVAPSDGSP